MKIIVLQDTFPPHNLGGAGIVAFNLAKAIVKMGHAVFVITAVQDKKDEGEIEQEGLKIFKIYSNYHARWRAYLSLYNPQTVGKIKKILLEVKPDVVHAHNVHYHLSYHSLKLAKKSGAKIFLTAHDVMLYAYGKAPNDLKISWLEQFKENKFRYNPLRNLVIRFYLRYTDKVIAVSNALKIALQNNGIKNAAVIHNGIDARDWEISQDEIEKFKNKHQLAGKKVVFFGGRLSGAKGGENMIKIMAQVVKKIPEAILLIAGQKTSYSNKLLKLGNELGLENRIIFLGWLGGVERVSAYHAGDVVVMPSLYLDPFPTINLEAMACKKPVVATCFGGASEIVQDGITGYIINPLDINTMAKKLVALLTNSALAKKFGEAGYERVKNNFTLKKQASDYISLFSEFLKN